MAGYLSRLRLEIVQPWIALAAAIVVSLALMAASDSPATDSARVHFTGILEVFARPLNAVPKILSLQAENARLRTDNAQLRMQTSQAQEAMLENQRLRRLLTFKERSGFMLTSAQVIGKDPLPGVRSLLISVGQSQGIIKNMAVINDRGLVGKIARVGNSTSVVQMLTDRNLGAAIRLSICRADGITTWAGGNRLMLEGLASSTPVKLGEEAVTSGLDGIFPEDLPVGQVVRTQRAEENLFLEVELEPAVDFAALEEVFVVREGVRSLLP